MGNIFVSPFSLRLPLPESNMFKFIVTVSEGKLFCLIGPAFILKVDKYLKCLGLPIKCTLVSTPKDMIGSEVMVIFTNLAPLGRVSLSGTMSVCH